MALRVAERVWAIAGGSPQLVAEQSKNLMGRQPQIRYGW
jgi:hypothetical protein